MFNYSTYFEAIYKKVILRGIIAPPSAYNKIDLYYVYFIKLFNNSVYEIDGDINGLIKINIILEYNENILVVLVFQYMSDCIARENKDRIFSFLAFISDSSNLD